MSKESYVRGFCKAAEAAGIDPEWLFKTAMPVFLPRFNILDPKDYKLIKNEKGVFRVPVEADGNNYLSETNGQIAVVGPNSDRYLFPDGLAALTNNPSITIPRVTERWFGLLPAKHDRVPAWRQNRNGTYVPTDDFRGVLENLSQNDGHEAKTSIGVIKSYLGRAPVKPPR